MGIKGGKGIDLKIPFGHAGVALIDKRGIVRFWDLGGGRNGKPSFAHKAKEIGRIKWDSRGNIIKPEKILAKLKRIFRYSGSLEAILIRGVNVPAATSVANKRPARYSVLGTIKGENCGTYVVKVLAAGGGSSITANVRKTIINTPAGIIPLLQNDWDERTFSV
jgi:hypothetical protein